MQLTGPKLGNITDSKNSRRVNPCAATRPRRWTEELVQNKQNTTPDPFIPLCRDVLDHHRQLYLSDAMLHFLVVQLERKKMPALLRKQEAPAVLFLWFSLLVKSRSPKQRAMFHWLEKKKKKAEKAPQSENLKYSAEELVSKTHRSCAAAALYRDVGSVKSCNLFLRRNAFRNQVQEAL